MGIPGYLNLAAVTEFLFFSFLFFLRICTPLLRSLASGLDKGRGKGKSEGGIELGVALLGGETFLGRGVGRLPSVGGCPTFPHHLTKMEANTGNKGREDNMF